MPPATFSDCTARFVSDLVGNLEDHFLTTRLILQNTCTANIFKSVLYLFQNFVLEYFFKNIDLVSTSRLFPVSHESKVLFEPCCEKTCLQGFLVRPSPEVIKHFSCSTQLSMNYILLINLQMPTIVGILTFISRINNCL